MEDGDGDPNTAPSNTATPVEKNNTTGGAGQFESDNTPSGGHGILETPSITNPTEVSGTRKRSGADASKELGAFFEKLAGEIYTPKEASKSVDENTDENTDPKSICIRVGCNKGFNQHMLVCGKCEKFIHYGCSELPAYQILMLKSKNYRKYRCESCVGEVPDNIKSNCEGADVKTLNEKCKKLEKVLAEKEKELDNLRTKHSVENKTTQTTSTWTSNEVLKQKNEKIDN